MQYDNHETGQKLVVAIIIATLAISLLSTAGAAAVQGTRQLPQGVVQFLLTAALCYFLFIGANWARWVAGILYLLSGIGSLLAGWALMQVNMVGILLLLMGIIYTASAVTLLFVPSVQEHFS